MLLSMYYLVFFYTGQFDYLNGQRSGRAEILIDDKYHYYLKVIKSDVQSRTMSSILYKKSVIYCIWIFDSFSISGINRDSESSIRKENTMPA